MDRKKLAANNLKKLRKESGKKQNEVAKDLEWPISTLSGYEIGKSEPSFENLVKIADYYKVSIDYILGRTRKKEMEETKKFRIHYQGYYIIEAKNKTEALEKDKEEAIYEEWERTRIKEIE